MTDEKTLPTAAPIRLSRAARPRFTKRVAAVGALVAGLAASGAVLAFAMPGTSAEVTASASLADEQQLPIELTIGQEAISDADSALDKARSAMDSAAASVDVDALNASVSKLEEYEKLSRDEVVGLTAEASEQADAVVAETAEARERAAAEKKRKAAEARREKEAERKAAEAIEAARSPAGAQEAARTIAADEFGWGGDQFGCLSNLWQKESGWNYQAQNASSGAYGIPQALPGSKMTSVAADWETNPLTQIRWGLIYIQGGYGTPCAAWGHSQAVNWY